MTTSAATFATTPEAITPEYLTDVLRASGDLQNGRVTRVEHQLIGTGKMGDNARLTLHYEGDAQGAPATMVAKLPAADEQARSMAGAQGAYYNEVMFYRELADHAGLATPNIYSSELSEDRTEFLLLMEDLAPAEPGDNLVGETRPHAERALGEVAKFAAAFYGDDSIAQRDYVVSPTRGDGGEFGQALLQQSWPGFVDRFGHGLSQDCIDFGEHFTTCFTHFISRYEGPRTIIHGDFRAENILFDDNPNNPRAVTVDWQTASEASVLSDASYFIGGSLDTEARRSWEKELVEHYRIALDQAGVSLSPQDCWAQYREQSMHGLLIIVLGASFSAPAERSDAMFLALIQRHLQHCLDADAAEFLPS